jgi:heparinase II/III-like protein
VIDRVSQFQQLWRHFGPEWLAYRVGYATRMRTGALRRTMPAGDWNEQPLKSFLSKTSLATPESYLEYRRDESPAFLFAQSSRADYKNHFSAWDEQSNIPETIAEEFIKGTFRYFEHTAAAIGFPPDWHANPFTGQRVPADLHWSEIRDFENGDIKVIWEPSRFAFAYALVRAYWRTGNERYAETFWQTVEDWQTHNPPQLGPNWKCGQEISFRVMAWCFGLYGFLGAEATDTSRVASLAQMIAISGARIAANLDYALSQHNNHGISEGLGLWTIGTLFPEFRFAEQWEDKGRQVLESLGRELIYDDGAFSQHSVNYHRLMLHDYLWALRLGEVSNKPFSVELKARVGQAGEFLYQIQDEVSGQVPYYGQNDGALILPLSNCDYQDFRPVTQATHYLLTATRRHSSGPWDEDLLWLFGPDAMKSELIQQRREDFKAEQGGCYTVRSKDGFAFTRCGAFRHRPAQADLLHVDLWWRGQNVAADAGTYSYNAPMPWDDPLAHTAYHNTVTVDGRDQMDRAGRFLWLPWATGRALAHQRSGAGYLAYWEGEHNGYQRLSVPAVHRRAILRLNDHWLILDRMKSVAEHDYRLHWLLMDSPYQWHERERQLAFRTPAGSYYAQFAELTPDSSCTLVRAGEGNPRGWRAPYYNYREPALSLEFTARAASVYFHSVFGPEPCQVVWGEDMVQLETDRWQASIAIPADEAQTLVSSVQLRGAVADELDHLEIA